MYEFANLSTQEEGPISSFLQIYRKAGDVCEHKLKTVYTLIFEKADVFQVIFTIADYAAEELQLHNEELVSD